MRGIRIGASAPRLLSGDVGRDPLRLVRFEAKKTEAAGKVIAWILSQRVDDACAHALPLAWALIELKLDVFSGPQRLCGLNARTADRELVDDDRLVVAIR